MSAISLLVLHLAVAPPVAASTPTWPDAGRLAAGGRHTCVVMPDAGVQCWGDNRSGQLGDGSVEPRTGPTVVAGLTDVTRLAAGTYHTCALRRDRSVACWGSTDILAARKRSTRPADVALRPVTDLGPADAIFAGRTLTCAVVDGRPWCWGRTSRRELRKPTLVPGVRDVDAVAIGWDYLCTRSGGQVACASPDPKTWERPERPTPLADISDAVDIAAGDRNLCILRAAGDILCVGQNSYPDQDRRDFVWLRQVPVAGITDAVRLMPTGNGHACAVLRAGEVRCWGDAGDGQLGHGLAQPWRSPVAVPHLHAPRAMAAGWGHTCAITAGHQVVCWGRNEAGQAGHLEVTRDIPELHPDPRSNRDSIASQLRGLLQRRLAPQQILDLGA